MCLELVGTALWFILPAYLANAAPVVVGGGRPIDGGRKLADGRPVFGPGKTVRGFTAGLVAGTAVGLFQGAITGTCKWPVVALLLSLGALVGDLLGSFIKRRLGISRGEPAPLLDQLDFLVMALIFASPLQTPSFWVLITLLIITPVLHLVTNWTAYKLGMKKHPW